MSGREGRLPAAALCHGEMGFYAQLVEKRHCVHTRFGHEHINDARAKEIHIAWRAVFVGRGHGLCSLYYLK